MKQKLILIVLLTAGLCGGGAAEPYTNAYEAIALFTKVLEERWKVSGSIPKGMIHSF